MLPNEMPKQQGKSNEVIATLLKIANNKIMETQMLNNLLTSANEKDSIFIKALIHSNKVVIEDLMRESGYMLPQSKYTFNLLSDLSKSSNNIVRDLAKDLINRISFNE